MNLNGSIEVALVYTTRDFWETVNWDLKGAVIRLVKIAVDVPSNQKPPDEPVSNFRRSQD